MDKLLSTSLKSCDSNRMKYNYCVHLDGRVDYFEPVPVQYFTLLLLLYSCVSRLCRETRLAMIL